MNADLVEGLAARKAVRFASIGGLAVTLAALAMPPVAALDEPACASPSSPESRLAPLAIGQFRGVPRNRAEGGSARSDWRETHQVETAPAYRRLYPDRVAVLEPAFGVTPQDGLITYSGGKLESLDVHTGRPRWPQAVACPTEPVLLAVDAGRHVFASRQRIFALVSQDGTASWQIGREPPADRDLDPESIASYVRHFAFGGCLYSLSDRGNLLRIAATDGAIRWGRELGTPVPTVLTANDTYFCCARHRTGGNEIIILDAATGHALQAVRPPGDQSVQEMLFSSGGDLILVLSRTILAVNPETGQSRWKIESLSPFLLASLQTQASGLYVSNDERIIARYDLATGRRVWRSQSVHGKPGDGLWTAMRRGSLYAGAAGEIAGYDPSGNPDGRPTWRITAVGALTPYAPIPADDAIWTVAPQRDEPGKAGTSHPASTQAEATAATCYCIRAFALADGEEIKLTADGALVSEPLISFGGLFIRDHCLVLLDGNRLIGYVAEADRGLYGSEVRD